MEKLVLIDGHSILNRAFYGMPDLTNSAGLHTGAVYGFLKILFKILDEEKPEYLTVAFDVHAPTFRHEAFADYKGTRHAMPDELREQVPLMKKVLAAMGIATCEEAGLEADDILGTLAKKAQADGMEVSLVSGDRDLLQIADEHIQIRIPKTKKGQTVIENYYAKDVKEALQVTPLEFIQVKALQGDTSDNIPGVPKVGPKTATELIVRYHSVDGVYEHLDEITKKGLHDTLEQNEDKARLSLFLAAIKTDADVCLDKDKARIGNFYTPEAFRLYTELGFKNLLPRFSMESVAAAGRQENGAGEENAGDSRGQKHSFRTITEAVRAEELFRELTGEESTVTESPEKAASLRGEDREEQAAADFVEAVPFLHGEDGRAGAEKAGRPAGRELPWIGVYPVYDRKGEENLLLGVSISKGGTTWFLQASGAELAAEEEPGEKETEAKEPAEPEGQLSFDFLNGGWKTQESSSCEDSGNGQTEAGSAGFRSESDETGVPAGGKSASGDLPDDGHSREEENVTGIPAALLTKGLSQLRKAAGRGRIRLAVFDLKSQLSFWGVEEEEFRDGIHLNGIFDVLLGAYLCNPLKNDYEPEDVASEYLGETILGKKQFLEKSSFAEKMAQDEELEALRAVPGPVGTNSAADRPRQAEAPAPGNRQEAAAGGPASENGREEEAGSPAPGMEKSGTVADFAGHISDTLAREAEAVRSRLQEEGMLELYETVELPLTYILYDMQRIGIRVVPEKLSAYGSRLVDRINELETSIHEKAGHAFNIASPKQLGQVLFGELGLPGGKKTKSGFSTAADVLDKLAPDYPIVAEILEYRALTKLKSTYADGLQAFIAKDSRIHTTFHQTITATGRISSTDPNLQNIPMRTELGRAIRKVFIPRDGSCFTDADYSQIELRILASLSGDEALIEAYRENRDIHRTTASRVFHTPFDEVTDLQRRNAKAVNFGIVYGISSFGLSQNLSISRSEAKEYIDEYFRMFPGIKTFLDREVEEAKERGYSVTMFGRRRPIPELKSSNFMQRQFGERVAMNAPIQGTGADIMKIAMIRVWEELHRQGLSSRLILQIHDELLIETAEGEEEKVAKILRDGMMGAAKLLVPLEIDCHTGSDWYEAK